MGWLTGWFEHNQVVHAAWLGAVGTSVAATFGVAAYLSQLRGRAQRTAQERVAQARQVWCTEALPTVETHADLNELVIFGQSTKFVVQNASQSPIRDVTVKARAVYQKMNQPEEY